MSKILVKQRNPLLDLLRNVKQQSRNPVDVQQLKEYFENVNNVLSGKDDRHAGQKLNLPPEGDFPTLPILSGNKFGSLNTFRNIVDESKNLQEQDVADKKLLERILSGEEFADMEVPSELGQDYDAIRDNTATHMEDIESEYEQYKKLMSIIGNPIMGFKDFAQAKGWIQPNDSRVGFLGLDDRQLLEQIRSGTPPPIHGSQIGDMSLQEFERKVPMDYGNSNTSSKSTPNDFMNLLKATIMTKLHVHQMNGEKNENKLEDFYNTLEKKQWAYKKVINHNRIANVTREISYFDHDDWDNILNLIFGRHNNPKEWDESLNSFEHLHNEGTSATQRKSLIQMQDFVSHPAVKKHIEDNWNELTNNGDGEELVRTMVDDFGMPRTAAELYQSNLTQHKNNKTDAFNQIITHQQAVGNHSNENPYFTTDNSIAKYGYLPNYSQTLGDVNQKEATSKISDDGMNQEYFNV